MILLSAASNLLLPSNETVTLALPTPTAVNVPLSSTTTTFSSLDVKFNLPASEGNNSATESTLSSTPKSSV